ncbi:hypothetical protein CHARACLAT_025899 [Characodon lateralis]|uniref:Uncharacterized protein n=1 Tax=Characodon lateralis TaxID=208331 RepID=A0ABU7CUQ8_9TELE|nr:hypothetical protein [Characodon lateralis]
MTGASVSLSNPCMCKVQYTRTGPLHLMLLSPSSKGNTQHPENITGTREQLTDAMLPAINRGSQSSSETGPKTPISLTRREPSFHSHQSTLSDGETNMGNSKNPLGPHQEKHHKPT